MSLHRTRLLLAALSLVLARPVGAGAQILPRTPDDVGARVRLGPLWLNPTLTLSDVGMDTNLFNDDRTEEPKRDLSLVFVPQTDVWMRAGRTWVTGSLRQDVIWFREHEDQRAANGTYTAGWVVSLTRFSLFVNGNWVRAKDRPSFEVDTRADRSENAVRAATEFRVQSRTLVGGRVERRAVRFHEGSFFERQPLHEQLNRSRTSAALTLRHELTPLTSVTADVSGYRDRFEFSPARDATSMAGSLGVSFDPDALLRGSARVGYRRFTPVSPKVPAFTGTTVSASLSLVTPARTTVSVEAIRDLEYSFEESQPYYVLTGTAASVIQPVVGPLDVFGRVGYHRLAYRSDLSGRAPAGDRLDQVVIVGGGPGYRLGERLRMTLDLEHHSRRSQVANRSYRGLRYGVTLTYGL